MFRILCATALLVGSHLGAQAQWQRLAPRTDFEPNQGAVAYEPNSGHGCFVGSVHTSNAASEVWRHNAGGWERVTTVTALPMFPPFPSLLAATWPMHGILVVAAGQSWLFDGTDWQHLSMPVTPTLTAMAFDAARGRMVGWRSSPSQVWEFDGAVWQQVAAAPLAVSDGRMAWHALLQRVVLYGTTPTARAAFSWDGATWTSHFWSSGNPWGFALAPEPGGGVLASGGWDTTYAYGRSERWDGTAPLPTSLDQLPDAPPWRATSVAWFDPVRGHTVVTSLHENWNTWLWDGATWRHGAAAPLPPSSDNVVYDSWRGEVLMAGGWRAPSIEHADLWARRNGAWRRIGTGPFAPRRGANVAFDSWRGRMVLFGGAEHDSGAGSNYTTGIPTGTYEWDGVAWTDRTPQPANAGNHPPPIMAAAIAFDRQRGQTVVFGGVLRWGSGNQVFTDTWQWDGSVWQRQNPVTVPVPLLTADDQPSMAFDAASARCWLLVASALWTWDGTDWSPAGTIPVAGPARGCRLAEDPARGRLILLTPDQQYERQGSTWVQVGNRSSSGAPTFDLGRGVIVGVDSGGTFEFGDPAAATIQPFGQACPGSAGVPVLQGDQPPILGTTLVLRLRHVPANHVTIGLLGGPTNSYQGLPLPIDLTPLGMPQCQLATAIDAAAVLFGGDWLIPLPGSAPWLFGATFRLQAVVLDPPANSLGAVTSNGVALRLSW